MSGLFVRVDNHRDLLVCADYLTVVVYQFSGLKSITPLDQTIIVLFLPHFLFPFFFYFLFLFFGGEVGYTIEINEN